MNRPIFRYEVEIRVRDANGSRLVMTPQHAYSVTDAVQQAACILKDVTIEQVTRVGPPLEDIRQQEKEIAEAIMHRMREVLRG